MAWAGWEAAANSIIYRDAEAPPSRLGEVASALSVSTFTRLFPEAENRGRCRCGGETVARTNCLRSGAVRAAAEAIGARGPRARTGLSYSGLNTISVWHAYCAGARGTVSRIGYHIWWYLALRGQGIV
jgi:hypothetical protein